MDFDWDEDKRRTNIDKHGVDFLDAALIFEGPFLARVDGRTDYGEVRMTAFGSTDGTPYVVVFTIRGTAVRLISARKGGRRDRRKYQAGFAGRNPADEGEG